MANRVMADHQPAANTAAVATISNGKNYNVDLKSAVWSYSATPTNGKLTITSGAVTVLEVDCPSAGPGFLLLEGFGSLVKGDAVAATLAAGGGTVVGKVALSGVYR